MSNTSTIHIKTDFDCIVYDYGQKIGTTKADTYFNIELRKGEHELIFVFAENESISNTVNYIVKDADCDYMLIIEIAETICDKADKQYDSENYSVAFRLYTLAAENGLAKAQNRLGICYRFGNGVEQNFVKAIEWFTKAAEQENTMAQCNLANCYEYGAGVERDDTKAMEWYTKAAEKGDAMAQNNLAICYYYDNSVEQNLVKAIEWFTKAAEQGNASAQYNLALCYYSGLGVKKDLIKSMEWYAKSTEQRNTTEQRDPPYCYRIGGPEAEADLINASEWYTKAAKQGDSNFYFLLAQHYETGDSVIKDYLKAFEYYIKAAEKSQINAQLKVAECYYNGVWVEKSLDKAVEWYTKAAEQGQSDAQFNLGNCYYNGDGIEKDLAKAVEWYTKAAEQGHANAQCNLGFCYEKGNGIEKDFAKAVEWYTKAAKQGNTTAQCNLGICYYNGNGVEKNYAKAVEWFTKAAEQGNENAKKALNRLKSIETRPIHYMFFDTETTGLPIDYFSPTYASKLWPRLVQLSWITTDENCNIISQNDFIIYPEGFTIPLDASKLHGITTDIAKEKGKPLKEVMDKFMEDFKAAKAIVGHNIDFDKKIISAELYRLRQRDIMNNKKSLCTMRAATNYCKIPGPYGYKHPKLQELHEKLFGCEFEYAHNSLSDVKATLKCFKEMRRVGWI